MSRGGGKGSERRKEGGRRKADRGNKMINNKCNKMTNTNRSSSSQTDQYVDRKIQNEERPFDQ